MPFPSPGDLPNPGIEPGFPALQADSLPSEPPGKPLRSISLDKGANTSGRIDTLLRHQASPRWPLTRVSVRLGIGLAIGRALDLLQSQCQARDRTSHREGSGHSSHHIFLHHPGPYLHVRWAIWCFSWDSSVCGPHLAYAKI